MYIDIPIEENNLNTKWCINFYDGTKYRKLI